MGADKDIVDRLPLWKTGPVLREYPGYFLVHERDIDEAAAEIVRLRGELDTAKSAYVDMLSNAMQAGLAAAHAPAMPNGVEGLVAALRDLRLGVEMDADYVDNATVKLAALDWAIAALRAADNRDAAGVCDCPGIGKADKALHAPNCPVRTAPAAVPAGEAVAVCGTCNGVGMIGGHRGQTPDSFEQWAEDCPDCTPQPADGEAVAWVCSPAENIAQHVGITSAERQKLIDNGFDVSHYRPLIYGDTTPPAPVQAAPQEGEAPHGRIRWLDGGYEIDWLRDWTGGDCDLYLAAHPSACELGAVRELVAKWREKWSGPYAADVVGRHCAYELEAALQHRGGEGL